MSAVTIPGTSLAESDQLGTALEKILLTVPEVVSTARRIGRAEFDEHVHSVESAEIDVALKMASRSKDEVLLDIREKVSVLPGTNVSVGQPISHRIDHMLSGTRANIAVKIFGNDLRDCAFSRRRRKPRWREFRAWRISHLNNRPIFRGFGFGPILLPLRGTACRPVRYPIGSRQCCSAAKLVEFWKGQVNFPLVAK